MNSSEAIFLTTRPQLWEQRTRSARSERAQCAHSAGDRGDRDPQRDLRSALALALTSFCLWGVRLRSLSLRAPRRLRGVHLPADARSRLVMDALKSAGRAIIKSPGVPRHTWGTSKHESEWQIYQSQGFRKWANLFDYLFGEYSFELDIFKGANITLILFFPLNFRFFFGKKEKKLQWLYWWTCITKVITFMRK